jgi:hypothetical protein
VFLTGLIEGAYTHTKRATEDAPGAELMATTTSALGTVRFFDFE